MPTGSRNAKSKPTKVDQEVEALLADSEVLPDRDDPDFTLNFVASVGEWRRNFRAVELVNGQLEARTVKVRGRTQSLAQHDLSRRVAERDNEWAASKGQPPPWDVKKHVVGVNRAVYVVKKAAPPSLPPPMVPTASYGPQSIVVNKEAFTTLEVWDLFRAQRRAVKGHSDYTFEKDAGYRRFLEASSFGTRRLSSLSEEDVSDLLDLYEGNHKPSTTYRAWNALKAFGDYARRRRYWTYNWFEDSPRGQKNGVVDRGRVLSFAEIDAWFRAGEDEPWLLAALWLLRLGCRAEDVLGISEEDITSDDTIEIRAAQKRVARTEAHGEERRKRGERLKLGRPKGFSAVTLRVGPHVVEALRRSLEGAVPCEVASDLEGGARRPRRFVVHNVHGGMYGYTGFMKRMREQAAEIGFVYGAHLARHHIEAPKAQLAHAWKHTFCSDLVALGAKGTDLREVARHTDEALTMGTYAKARDEDRRQFRPYVRHIARAPDFIPAIVQMDLDRRAGKPPWGAEWATARPLKYPGLLRPSANPEE